MIVILSIILGLLAFLIGYGLYLTIGPGKDNLRDSISEHSKMHELGIAHGHNAVSYTHLTLPTILRV